MGRPSSSASRRPSSCRSRSPRARPDERFLFLSDVLPTAWQSVVYADVPDGGTLLVLGLGPIGDMATRIALHQGFRVIAVDLVPERLARAQTRGAEVIDLPAVDDVAEEVRSRTQGRAPTPSSTRSAWRPTARPSPRSARRSSGALPKRLSSPIMDKVGLDRMAAIYTAIDAVRRGGTVSLIGVYGGQSDPMPMMTLFDKQIQLRMGQANVKRWVDDLMPLLIDDADPLGTEQFATHQCRSSRPRRPTRTSRRRPTARSRSSSSPEAGLQQVQGACGGRLGRRAVGGDQPDAGAAVQQVVDVEGALVRARPRAARPRVTARRRRPARAPRRRTSRPRAVGQHGGRLGAVPAHQPRRGGDVRRASSSRGGADQRQVAGAAGPAGIEVRASARSTASSAIRRYVVSLPPTTVTTPSGEVEHGVPAGEVGGRAVPGPASSSGRRPA